MIRGPVGPRGPYNRPLQREGRGRGWRSSERGGGAGGGGPTAFRPCPRDRVGTYRLVYHLNLPETPRLETPSEESSRARTLRAPASTQGDYKVLIAGGSCYAAIRSDLRRHPHPGSASSPLSPCCPPPPSSAESHCRLGSRPRPLRRNCSFHPPPAGDPRGRWLPAAKRESRNGDYRIDSSQRFFRRAVRRGRPDCRVIKHKVMVFIELRGGSRRQIARSSPEAR